MQSELVCLPGSEIHNDHIGAFTQAADGGENFRIGQVGGDGALAAILVQKLPGLGAADAGAVAQIQYRFQCPWDCLSCRIPHNGRLEYHAIVLECRDGGLVQPDLGEHAVGIRAQPRGHALRAQGLAVPLEAYGRHKHRFA